MEEFSKLIGDISDIGLKYHNNTIISNSKKNRVYYDRSISDLPDVKNKDKPDVKNNEKAVVISAGPSLHRRKTIDLLEKSNFDGVVVTIDGAYVKCLKSGIIPDYVLTLDPHPKRVVRWFGDPFFGKNQVNDDYFARQDLDVDFRKNSIEQNLNNIELVNRYASKSKLIIALSKCTMTLPLDNQPKIFPAKTINNNNFEDNGSFSSIISNSI